MKQTCGSRAAPNVEDDAWPWLHCGSLDANQSFGSSGSERGAFGDCGRHASARAALVKRTSADRDPDDTRVDQKATAEEGGPHAVSPAKTLMD